jgi:nitroreductase
MADLAATDHLLATTRSVRRRLDLSRPVPRELILECLRLAVQAPTGGNLQGWRWLVVDDENTKRALGELYRRTGDSYLASYQREGMAEQTVRVLDSSVHLAEVMGQVPAMVIPCIKGRVEDPSPVSASSFYGSIIPAIWSFQLAARSRGLGTCYTTLHLAHEADAAELLGIPEDVTQVALIPVAYYTGDDFRPAARGPVERITYLNRWKS